MHQMIRMTKKKLGREYVLRYKRAHHCIKCNERRVHYLTFHHRDPTKKSFSIGRAVHNGFPLHQVIQELRKCVVICKECHEALHGNKD